MKYYLAYGSNLSIEQMRHRCPNARIVGRATLHNWKLVFRYYATIERKLNSSVPVLVWKIDEQDEKNLDRYEGYPRSYIKDTLKVDVTHIRTGEQKTLEAMVYIMAPGRPITPPEWWYYDIIREGYKRFKFNLEILKHSCREAYFDMFPGYAKAYKREHAHE